MKQQASILQWASIVLDREVRTLRSIQEVGFVKHLLFRIDSTYFSNWQDGRGSESYAQVLQAIARYFLEDIQTDISSIIEGINVYTSVMEVWELALGIAIKGRNRGSNINLIFQMDKDMQAELAAIVSSITDKFGQRAATPRSRGNSPRNDDDEDRTREMLMNLVDDNQDLKERVRELEAEIEMERRTAMERRVELQQSLELLRLEKLAFLETMASANRSDSRIFDDDDSQVTLQASLPELANDIVVFIREQRRRLALAQDRAAHLQEGLRQSRNESRRIAEQNEQYIQQLNSSSWEREMEALRSEMSSLQAENAALFEQVAVLTQQRMQLLNNQGKIREYEEKQREEKESKKEAQALQNVRAEAQKPKMMEKKTTIAAFKELQKESPGESVRDSDWKGADSGFQPAEGVSVRKQMDELRQPNLRNKLQREITHLKTSLQHMQRQNEALKRANQTLQKSAQQLIEGNQTVIEQWEHDYNGLLNQMEALKIKDLPKIEESPIEQLSESTEPKEESSPIRKLGGLDEDRVALWDAIVNKLRQVVKDARSKELAYENTIHFLRSENVKLMQRLQQRLRGDRDRDGDMASSRVTAYHPAEPQPQESPRKQHPYLSRLNIQKVDSLQVNDLPIVPKMAFLSLVEGEDLDQQSTYRPREKSTFFQMNSVIIDGLQEVEKKTIREESQLEIPSAQDYYANLNRKLCFSINDNLDGLARTIEFSQSVELQQKLEQETTRIGEQYRRLNDNYQAVFGQLAQYSQRLSEKQTLKEEQTKLLQEITEAEQQAAITHQNELVKLTHVNNQLRQHLAEAALQKQDILATLSGLAAPLAAARQQGQSVALRAVETALRQAEARFSGLSEPMGLVQTGLEEGQLQQFYRLYLREKERSQQLDSELQILTAVLLEYRNLIE